MMPNGSDDRPPLRGPFLVDGHVHLHRCFDEARFFASAAANLAAAARDVVVGGGPAGGGWTGCLLFTEVAGENRFRDLAARGAAADGGWRITATGEDASLIAVQDGGRGGGNGGEGPPGELVLVAGRQLRTREGLEVLALGTAREFEDDLPLGEAVAAVRAAGALAVVPWGFGKWWFGRRRRVVAGFIATTAPGEAFLGDNGNRARLSPPPAPFRRAARRGIWVLPGSDPLPLPSEVDKVGSYGFVLDDDGTGGGAVSRATPARDLLGLIRMRAAPPRAFGRREDVVPFLRNQVAMQLRAVRREAAAS